jgi:hypothetical protein
MTVLDGLQRNTILVRNKTLEGRPRVLGKLNPRKGLLLHSLAMCGMKHLVITMMRLLDTTTMEIQVSIMTAIVGFGTRMTSKHNNMFLVLIRTMRVK